MAHRAHRRRAEELADALRAATLAELAEHGYAGVTFEGVARRAHTSKPVLYRRYRSRSEMVLDAITQAPAIRSRHIDTGSLRGDLTALLEQLAAHLEQLGPEVYRGVIAEAGHSLTDAITELDGGPTRETMRTILNNARARGEIGPGPLPDRVVLLPIVMLRHDALIGLETDPASIADMIDSVCLPLLTSAGGPAEAGKP